MNIFHRLYHCLMAVWLLPIRLIVFAQRNMRFYEDLAAWAEWKSCPYTTFYMRFVFLMSEYREFRNICYYRMGKISWMVHWICRPLDSLFIHCKDIGGG